MSLPSYKQNYVPQGYTAVTPNNDGPELNGRGFMVTVAGNVGIEFQDGGIGVMPMCQPGVQYFGAIKRLRTTGTTATGVGVLK